MSWYYMVLLVLAAATAAGAVARSRGVRLPLLPERPKPYVGRHTARYVALYEAAGDTGKFPVVAPTAVTS